MEPLRIKYAIKREDWFDSKVSVRSTLAKFGIVYDHLNDEYKEMLLKSCFGNFHYLNDGIQMSGKLLHSLMLRRIAFDDKLADNEVDEILFSFDGEDAVCFSYKDFILITGLNSGNEEEFRNNLPGENRLANEYFNEFGHVTVEDLEAVFKEVEDEEDKYKLGLVLIYERILRAKEIGTSIEMDVLNIVDNLELFNKYPWGRRCFTFTVHGYRREFAKATGQYSLWGFPLALQVWAFETIPSIASLFQTSMTNRNIPRMLRWNSNVKLGLKSISRILDSPNLKVRTKLSLTPEEKLLDCMRFFDTDSEGTQSDEAEGVSPDGDFGDTQGTSIQEDVHRPPSMQHRSTSAGPINLKRLLNAILSMDRRLSGKIDALEQKMNALDQKMEIILQMRPNEEADATSPFWRDEVMHHPPSPTVVDEHQHFHY